jgi:hypothetical protein
MSCRNVDYDMWTGSEDENMMKKGCGDEWLSSDSGRILSGWCGKIVFGRTALRKCGRERRLIP